MNFVIAAALLLGVDAIGPNTIVHLDDPAIGAIERLAATNLFLGLFNLVPAFPMDGGRVLRAALAMWLGQERATRIAALIGQAFALVLGFLGLFGNPMLLFIAFFVFLAATRRAIHRCFCNLLAQLVFRGSRPCGHREGDFAFFAAEKFPPCPFRRRIWNKSGRCSGGIAADFLPRIAGAWSPAGIDGRIEESSHGRSDH